METELNLQRCPKSVLDNLPENMEVRGGLDLQGTEIKSLPEGLKIGEWLWLRECYDFQFLPNDLKVGWWLGLENCPSLNFLPDGLKIGSNLDIRYCRNIETIPQDIKVGNKVWINSHDYEGTRIIKKDFPKILWKKIKES